MLRILLTRLKQGHRTSTYPAQAPLLPDRFRGLPVLDPARCPEGCEACREACPTDAISVDEKGLGLDLGRCLFCHECASACPQGAIQYTTNHQLAARQRAELIVRGEETRERARALEDTLLRLFRRSLKLRVVSAGDCGACNADVNVLSTLVFDLGRFGIQYVASPRHADGLLITGPVTENMKVALLKTYEAVPAPKIVIAVGACAISGGPFAGHEEVHDGADSVIPVDLYIPGCPPHPFTILDGLLALLDRLGPERMSGSTLTSGPDDETLKWGLLRAEQGMKYLGVDLGKGQEAQEPTEGAPEPGKLSLVQKPTEPE